MFFMMTLVLFFARDIPPSSRAKPACMKNTSAADTQTQAMSAGASSVAADAVPGTSASATSCGKRFFCT